MIDQAKELLRKAQLKARHDLSPKQRVIASERVCNRLVELVKTKKPKAAHCFIPMGNEIDTKPFIEYCLFKSITVVSPKTLKNKRLKHLVLSDLNSIESGVFGTVYPSGNIGFSGELDLIIVPGLAFDNDGGRLGYGGGYYDTFLSDYSNALKVGVGFNKQLVDKVPLEEHDVRLDSVFLG